MARAGGHERSCSATDMNRPADSNFPGQATTGRYRTGRVVVWPTGRNVSLMLGAGKPTPPPLLRCTLRPVGRFVRFEFSPKCAGLAVQGSG